MKMKAYMVVKPLHAVYEANTGVSKNRNDAASTHCWQEGTHLFNNTVRNRKQPACNHCCNKDTLI
jgi:hypothetical protein